MPIWILEERVTMKMDLHEAKMLADELKPIVDDLDHESQLTALYRALASFLKTS